MKNILKWIVLLLPFLGLFAVMTDSGNLQFIALLLAPIALIVGLILTIISATQRQKPSFKLLLTIGITYLLIGILGIIGLIGLFAYSG